MTCNEVRQHWMLYLDSEGDAELHFRISDHLGMCPACAEWFSGQERFEKSVTDRLAAGEATPELWERVLSGAGISQGKSSRRRFIVANMLAAAVMLLAVGLSLWATRRPEQPDLSRMAADLHEQLLRGQVHPDFVSTSDQEVDRYLKTQAPFRVHCPPRTDVQFAVKGAGICRIKEQEQAAYIIGQVDGQRVSILVLDRASLPAFPHESAHLQGGKLHRCREGDYRMISCVIADNVVLVIGTAPSDALEKLLNAYGTYREG